MKVIAALSALLAAHSASADDMSFSMYGVKSGKGMSKSGKGGDMSFSMDMGKSGKGGYGKSGKGDYGSAKASKKGAFDDCVFVNPALEQLYILWDPLGLDEGRRLDEVEESKPSGLRKFQQGSSNRKLEGESLDLEEFLLYHAYSLNDIYGWLVKRYVNKGMTAEEIYEFGEIILNEHHPIVTMILEEWCELSCAKIFAVIGQMQDTCNDNKFMSAYVNVALAMLSGMYNGEYDFGHGHGHGHGHGDDLSLNVLECTYWGYSDTVDEIFGKYITDEVRDLVDKGDVCGAGHGHGHGHGLSAGEDLRWAFSLEEATAHLASLEEPESASLTEESMSM